MNFESELMRSTEEYSVTYDDESYVVELITEEVVCCGGAYIIVTDDDGEEVTDEKILKVFKQKFGVM